MQKNENIHTNKKRKAPAKSTQLSFSVVQLNQQKGICTNSICHSKLENFVAHKNIVATIYKAITNNSK